MSPRRLFQLVSILAVLVLVPLGLVSASAPFVAVTTSLVTIDGNPTSYVGEWTGYPGTTGTFFAPLCANADCTANPAVAYLYLEYTCFDPTMFMLVHALPGHALTTGGTHFVALTTEPNKILTQANTSPGSPPYYPWIKFGPPSGGVVSNWEGQLVLSPGTYSLYFATTVDGMLVGTNAKFQTTIISCSPTAVKLSSLDAQRPGDNGLVLFGLGIGMLAVIAGGWTVLRRK